MYVDFAPLIQRLEQYWAELQVSTFQGRHIEIPVIYGGELGQDLSEVAKLHDTTPERTIPKANESTEASQLRGCFSGTARPLVKDFVTRATQ